MELYDQLSEAEQAKLDIAWEKAKRAARKAAKKARKQTTAERENPGHVHGEGPSEEQRWVRASDFAAIVRAQQNKRYQR